MWWADWGILRVARACVWMSTASVLAPRSSLWRASDTIFSCLVLDSDMVIFSVELRSCHGFWSGVHVVL